MRLKLITICPIAMDTEDFAAAFYCSKAVMSQHSPLFARRSISVKVHFPLLLLSPSVQLAHIFHTAFTNAKCIFCRLFIPPGVFFHKDNTVHSCSVYDTLKPADLSCKIT